MFRMTKLALVTFFTSFALTGCLTEEELLELELEQAELEDELELAALEDELEDTELELAEPDVDRAEVPVLPPVELAAEELLEPQVEKLLDESDEDGLLDVTVPPPVPCNPENPLDVDANDPEGEDMPAAPLYPDEVEFDVEDEDADDDVPPVELDNPDTITMNLEPWAE